MNPIRLMWSSISITSPTATLTERSCPALIDAPSTSPCTVTDPVATKKWAMLPANFTTVSDLQMNIMVQAVACGLTNLVTFMWSNSETDMQFPWLNVESNVVFGLAIGNHSLTLLLVMGQLYLSTVA